MSMTPDIMKRYLHLPTARDIWAALSKAFYDGSDELQVYALNQKAFSAKQKGRAISVNYGELTEIFGELDHRDKVIMENAKDVETYRKSVQRQRVHIFLAGLDGDFEQIRGEILQRDPIPKLEECYALIRRAAVRRTMMNGDFEDLEALAMVAHNRPPQTHPKKNGVDKNSYKCTHCDQTGHTKSRCFELVGYPDWWDHNCDSHKKNSRKSNPTTAVVETQEENDAGTASAHAATTTSTDDWVWY
ncbi:uncharacterized protein LOC108988785 isoform X2 [Juglans regia]|uniref:Uncharacterized protein LOC108988785 isoform X2 n=2 Tax=Juglans regia TaxID=51240 RepID=A0A2I4EE62_JUGRE|nr:uncharacterized protein LOC108988785 isoform X2 [Juglans regia]